MKKSKKIAVFTAVGMIAAGLIIAFAAIAAMGFDLTKTANIDLNEKTYSLTKDFSKIYVNVEEFDICFLPSENNICKITCYENDKIYFTVTDENNTLTIERHDKRKWYEHIINIYWGKPEIIVYLPQKEFESICIKATSGNISVPEGFIFKSADIQNASGAVKFSAETINSLYITTVSGSSFVKNISAKTIDISSTSGDIIIDSIKNNSEFIAKTVSGSINASGINCQTFNAYSTSGKINISHIIAEQFFQIESVSGNIEINKCDSDKIQIKTNSGDVTGSLLTEKIFFTDTHSGKIDVPKSFSGGECEISTVSGDIKFDICDFDY